MSTTAHLKRVARPAEKVRQTTIAPATELAPVDWREWFRAWLAGPDSRACGASLLLHLSLLTCLSLMAFRHSSGESLFALAGHQGGDDSDQYGLEDVLGHDVLSLGGSPIEVQTTITPGAQLSADTIRPELSLETAMGEIDMAELAPENSADLLTEVNTDGGGGGGRGKGKGSSVGNLTEGFSKPGGGRGVARRGKFSAWTVPSDPKPFQNYLIVIEVQWPKTRDKKLLEARRTDLTGTVEGTDQYFQIIEQTGKFIQKSSQMVIAVPGAERNVEDTIKVRSRILDEEQELRITF